MAIAFTALEVRHERRVRLLFSETLAAGAFGSSAAVLALYVLACTDGSGANPTVSAAIALPDTPNGVDLALGLDLVAGGQYEVTTDGVPGADPTTSGSTTTAFSFGALTSPATNVEFSEDDVGALVYGTDLVWTGADFGLTPTGDLATIAGVDNVKGALARRLKDASGIAWDPSWGAQAGQFINGPSGNGMSLLAQLRRQAVADNRVQSATVQFLDDPSNPGDSYFPVKITLRGDNGDGNFTIDVNPPGASGST